MRSEAGDPLCELPYRQCKRLLAEGKVDAYLGFPPDTQELRARKVGHVLANNTVDRPWSQYFCCLATGHREFVRKHPNATKRALRAILKAADIWGLEPERAARALVDGGFTPRYDYALETMKNVRTTSGASTIRKTPFASMPFASARRE